MNAEVNKVEKNELYFANYFFNLPLGDKGEFLLVVRLILYGTDDKWYRRFRAWKRKPLTRKLNTHEKDKLEHLTTNDQWRKTLEIFRKLTTRL